MTSCTKERVKICHLKFPINHSNQVGKHLRLGVEPVILSGNILLSKETVLFTLFSNFCCQLCTYTPATTALLRQQANQLFTQHRRRPVTCAVHTVKRGSIGVITSPDTSRRFPVRECVTDLKKCAFFVARTSRPRQTLRCTFKMATTNALWRTQTSVRGAMMFSNPNRCYGSTSRVVFQKTSSTAALVARGNL